MGRPKLLQELGGKVSFLCSGAALSSRVDEVIVVLPPGQEELLRLVKSYRYLVVNNRFKKVIYLDEGRVKGNFFLCPSSIVSFWGPASN